MAGDYIKGKIKQVDKLAERDKKQQAFLEGMQKLKASEAPVLDRSLSEGFAAPIKSSPINTKEIVPQISGDDFIKKIADKRAAKAAGKKLLGAVPVLGGLVSAAMTQDASAAVPILDSAESLGPAPGSLDDRIERGTLTEEDKQLLRKQALGKINNWYY